MNWQIIEWEGLVVVNIVFLLVFAGTVAQVVAQKLIVVVSAGIKQYFEAKKEFLEEIARLDISDRDIGHQVH
jgi:hypothetical protein